MRGIGRWSWTAAFVLTLGCAAEQGAAQDAEPPVQQAPQGGNGAAKKDADEAPAPKFIATVKDRFLQEPWQVRGAVLFVPEVSLFGGGGGKETRVLVVKCGAAEVEIPLERVTRIAVGETNEDLLAVEVSLRGTPTEQAPLPIKGTVRSSLELHGTFGTSDLKTVVKLREASWLELTPEKP